MTNEEICRDYRQAKNRVKQIGILADLTGKTRQEIIEILTEGGCEIPGNMARKPKLTAETVNVEAEKEKELAELRRALQGARSDIEALKETIVRLAMERMGVTNR